ncbi:MAG: hypothetical protein WC711_01215 [Candidatus Staskawiczbacteria bacterium]
MDILTGIIIVLVVGVAIWAFIKFALKPAKCAVCGSDTKDIYRDEKDNIISFCKNHLLERWEKDFTSSNYDIMIIEPDFVHYPYGYLYATVDKLKEWQYTKEDQGNVSNILDNIKGKVCKKCGSRATVAYFNKEDYEFPHFRKISSMPVYFCKNCAVKKVEPFLRDSSKDFVEGLYAPTNDRGVYHIQEF